MSALDDRAIIELAVRATSMRHVAELERAITRRAGGEFRRPLGDAWNNFGLMSHSGDFDHKLIENVTNAQDAVLERLAAARHGAYQPVPYDSPHAAAAALTVDLPADDLAQRIHVDIRDCGDNDEDDHRVTFQIRDDGCGMTPEQLPETILRLGSSHKSHSAWQQGAFGLGAKSTFRNARAIVIVTRRAPELMPDSDRISVVVITWAEYGKGMAASYLTDRAWDDSRHPDAVPWSVPATEEIGFGPGTHVALISYQVRGLHRARSGDDRAFHAVAQTRLIEPVLPFRHTSHLIAKPEPRTVRGLGPALRRATEQRSDIRHGHETLPFNLRGTTYQLPIDWYVFPAPAAKPGGRGAYTAAGHVVTFTSAGQAHHHWNQPTFKDRTRLAKLDSRFFATVTTDPLPIELRTRLFTPDRSALLPSDDSLRLEAAVAAFLDDADELIELNAQVIREEVERSLGDIGTRNVAQRISRAFRLHGFQTRSQIKAPGWRSPARRCRPSDLELHSQPTTLRAPETLRLRAGQTRTANFWINADDRFVDTHDARIGLTCEHPEIHPGQVAVGHPRRGRIPVTITVPDDATIGTTGSLRLTVTWTTGEGKPGGPLNAACDIEIVEPTTPRPDKPSQRDGGARDAGGEVALVWTDSASKENWTTQTPGEIEDVPASLLAGNPEYRDLRRLGDTPIPTIYLNTEYRELARYLKTLASRRSSMLSGQRARDKYAQGVGVGLLVLREQRTFVALGDEERVLAAQGIARATLSLLPDFDRMASHVGELSAPEE